MPVVLYNPRYKTMRVVGGTAKGRRLRGAEVPGARPTSELVRGAIFNVLGRLDLMPVRVLDLYAGTGSLGIEALSRGAQRADFVERHPRQCDVIRSNLEATDCTGKAQIYCKEVDKALEVLGGPYQLVLMDPPYRLTTLDEVLGALGRSDLLGNDATVVVGHSKRITLKGDFQGLILIGSYRYGDSAVDFFEKGDH